MTEDLIVERRLATINETSQRVAALEAQVSGVDRHVQEMLVAQQAMAEKLDRQREASKTPLIPILTTTFAGFSIVIVIIIALGQLGVGLPLQKLETAFRASNERVLEHTGDGHPRRVEERLQELSAAIREVRPDPYRGSDAKRDFDDVRRYIDLKDRYLQDRINALTEQRPPRSRGLP